MQDVEKLQRRLRQVNLELEDTNRQLYVKVEELHNTTAHLQAILSHMAQGILFVGFDGIITSYNNAAETIFERPRAHVLLHSFWDSFPDTLFNFSMREALEKRESLTVVFSQTEGAKELEISTQFIAEGPLFNWGLLILVRDITEMRRLQTVASRHERMQELGEMAATVAHEIRNPLAGIEGFAGLLQRDLSDNPKLKQMAHYILEGTRSLNRLVTHVLQYARPVAVQLQLCDLVNLVERLFQEVQVSNLLGKKRRLLLQKTVEHLPATADPPLLKAALMNLIINAVQASPQGGDITLTIEEKERRAQLIVTDQGEGIPAKNIEKIFSPFFTTKEQGNGLGLPEVYKIVQAHGGTIEVQSQVGQGAAFMIRLPLQI